MSKIQASDLADQTEDFDEDKKLITEDQLYPAKRVQTPLPNMRTQFPSAVEHMNKGQFDVIDIVEELQNHNNSASNHQVLIDQTGMSPYDSREENSRMQSAEPQRSDARFQMKKVKLAKSIDQHSEIQDYNTYINISSNQVMLPGELRSTSQENNYFMHPLRQGKPGLQKNSSDANNQKQPLIGQEGDIQGSEEIDFQTSEAVLQEQSQMQPTKSRKKERKYDSTDSDEMEDIMGVNSLTATKISDKILQVATNELSEVNSQLAAFFDEEGIQKSMCRNIVQHPELDKYFAASGEFGNELRLFDVKNIEKGNHRFECMMRRVNICQTDLKDEQIKMRKNLSEAFSFFRIIYDALEDQMPDTLKTYNECKKKIENFDPKKSQTNINETNKLFKQAKNILKDIYINSFCLLGDDDGHVVIGLNKIQKAVLLKPTETGAYQKVDELHLDLVSLDQKMNIMQVEAASDCFELSHKAQSRSQYDKLLTEKKDELLKQGANQNQIQIEMKKMRMDLKRKFQERYFKVFVFHKCQMYQTAKLSYHLVAYDNDKSQNDGNLYFVKESQYQDIYKMQQSQIKGKQSNGLLQSRQYKNVVNLRAGSSHFFLNDECLDGETTKQEVVVCVKAMGKLLKSCFDIRRFEDLSIKRHLKSSFSPTCILRDKQDMYCLTIDEDRGVTVVKANFNQLSLIDHERVFQSERQCKIRETEYCFDGISAEQIVSAGPYLIIGCMQKLSVLEKKLNRIIMQVETMGRIKSMTLSRNQQQLFIQTEDNYLYCIIIDQISQIKYLEEGMTDPIPYTQISKIIADYTTVESKQSGEIEEVEESSITINNLIIAKANQLWLQKKSKLYTKSDRIAYFPNQISDIIMDNEGERIFIMDDQYQLFVYLIKANKLRFMMKFESNARMWLAYMPKIQPFNRATQRMRASQINTEENEEEITVIDAHLLIAEGDDDDISFYKIHVPEPAILLSLKDDVQYGIYENDSLRYWGPIKQPDMFKVVSICYFEKTIFVLFQGQERETKFIRRFDEHFDRQEELRIDFRQLSKQIDDYQLEDEAQLTQTSEYLIISYLNKTEYILEDPKQRRRINVFRTVDADYLEQGFVVLSYFDGAVVASVSEEGHYIVVRNIDQNQVLFKQELNFIPHQIIIDEHQQRFLIKECYKMCIQSKRLSQEFRQSYINESIADNLTRRSSLRNRAFQVNQSFRDAQELKGYGRLYEFSLGILMTKKCKDRQYNSLKKEMLRYQLHCASNEEREAYLKQANQFYTMVKMTANFVTISCCMGLKEKEMQQAIDMGIPVITDMSGKSPIHFSKITNNLTSLRSLVHHYQKQEHFIPINVEDRDYLIQSFQSDWKDMFCFGKPIYFKSAQDFIQNGLHGIIKPQKEIIYTQDSEISKQDILESIIFDIDEHSDQRDCNTIEGQTFRIKLNMQIETETCYNFLKLLKNTDSQLLEQSQLDIIIQHSFNQYYETIALLSFIHILQALVVVLRVITQSLIPLQVILAILIIAQQLVLLVRDELSIFQSKLKICSMIGNILAIINALSFQVLGKEYEWNNRTATEAYFTCIMVLLIFVKAINSLIVIKKFRLLIWTINQSFYDLFYFFVLLVCYVLVFSTLAFVSENYSYDERIFFFNFGERWRQVFGESLIETYYDSEGALGWIIYFLFTIVVHIVMLNLLIHLVYESYQGTQAKQKSNNTRAMIQMLIEVGIFQRLIKNIQYKLQSSSDTSKQLQREDKLYYVHRFVVAGSDSSDENDQDGRVYTAPSTGGFAASTPSKGFSMQPGSSKAVCQQLIAQQHAIYEEQKDLSRKNDIFRQGIAQEMRTLSEAIREQMHQVAKKVDTYQTKTLNTFSKQLVSVRQNVAKGDGSEQVDVVQVQSAPSDANGEVVMQIQNMSANITSQLESKQVSILSQLAEQQQNIDQQNNQIKELLYRFQDKPETQNAWGEVKSGDGDNQQNQQLNSGNMNIEQLNNQIKELEDTLRCDQQNTQNQISDIKHQIEQVVTKMGYLQNAVNDMKEAKEDMANTSERLKEDIQNMLFEQKHEILGSISSFLDKQKSTEEQTQIEDGDNDDIENMPCHPPLIAVLLISEGKTVRNQLAKYEDCCCV